MRTLPAALAGLLLALPVATRAGEVTGTVRFQGTAPAPAPLETTKEKALCGESVPDESLRVGKGGGLAGAVVVVKGVPAPSPAKAVLDQQRCRFVPHVQAVPVGSTLELVNGDPTLHNVHGYLGQATAFNLAMPSKDARASRVLKKPGVVVVKCDVHAWMSAFVVVADGPSAVTGDDGGFAIPGVPPGTWEVTAWHERLGERKGTVTVPAQGPARVDFTFGN
jgi:plastocyanin